ncbi:galectin-8-like protein [Dinothrombium tinctorium]|uniref:Galectin n=1 Tax=Dinothrombium tinctorium TaxID=1965070 RepID=A0A443QKX4_9ACAR|nr:galectin-8-like protein [Dinothrombium tinctorium]
MSNWPDKYVSLIAPKLEQLPKLLFYSNQTPYSEWIPEQVKPGLLIDIRGRVKDKASRQINFLDELKEEIAFHFNPRFNERCVARNSCLNDEWGEEEEEPRNVLPFQCGYPFQLLILVTHECYKVAVNGIHFIEFNHRFPYTKVKYLEIDGDVSVENIHYGKDPATLDASSSLLSKPYSIYNPELPFYHLIAEKIVPGFMIYINGAPIDDPCRITFNFKKMATEDSDIPFHFDIRFDEGSVVRNTLENYEWGVEERAIPSFPFSSAANFDLIFLVQNKKFMVVVDGKPYIEYTHRIALTDIAFFHIEGDLNVFSVSFCD